MERTISAAMGSGRFPEALKLARALVDTDPSLDQVQATLVKMYRVLGAHAAAAEQYQLYASVMRDDFGLDPPPLDQM